MSNLAAGPTVVAWTATKGASVERHADKWDQQEYWERHAASPEHGLDSADADTSISPPRERRRLRVAKVFAIATCAIVIGAVAVSVLSYGPRAAPNSVAEPPPPGVVTYRPFVPSVSDGLPPTPSATTSDSSPAPETAGPSPVRTPAPSRTTTTQPVRAPNALTTQPAPASAVVTTPASGMVVRVVSRTSGQLVGVNQGATQDGASIVTSASVGAAQQWRLASANAGCFHLINAGSGKALDNPNGTFTDGTQMQQWTIASGNTNQMWCFRSVGNGLFSIRNLTSGSLLDLRDGRLAQGTAIQEWSADPAAPNANQIWQLLRVN